MADLLVYYQPLSAGILPAFVFLAVGGWINRVDRVLMAEGATWLIEAREYPVTFETFSLDARIQAGIRTMGFETPTPIQEQAIPQILAGHDVLGLAQTGTGKTAAFMLPILQRLTRGPRRNIRALILAPTRELAEQTHETTRQLGRNLPVRSMTIYGGVSKNRQIEQLRRGVEIVVACPGRLLDIAGDGKIDLTHVEVLVLDEADRMCDMGFIPDIRRILNMLPRERQTLFFSATMPDDIKELSGQFLRKPVNIQIGMIAPAKTVSHALYPVAHDKKKKLLMNVLDQTRTGRVLIFTRTKHRARYLSRDLGKRGFHAAELQGNMSQNARQRAIDGFRSGKYDILVATDIASRGIDVEDITHVINYDMPDTVDAYTHRIGRTGRAELTGKAFTFTTPTDQSMVREIEKVLGYRIERCETSSGSDAHRQSPQPVRTATSNQGSNRMEQKNNGGRPKRHRKGSPTSHQRRHARSHRR